MGYFWPLLSAALAAVLFALVLTAKIEEWRFEELNRIAAQAFHELAVKEPETARWLLAGDLPD